MPPTTSPIVKPSPVGIPLPIHRSVAFRLSYPSISMWRSGGESPGDGGCCLFRTRPVVSTLLRVFHLSVHSYPGMGLYGNGVFEGWSSGFSAGRSVFISSGISGVFGIYIPLQETNPSLAGACLCLSQSWRLTPDAWPYDGIG